MKYKPATSVKRSLCHSPKVTALRGRTEVILSEKIRFWCQIWPKIPVFAHFPQNYSFGTVKNDSTIFYEMALKYVKKLVLYDRIFNFWTSRIYEGKWSYALGCVRPFVSSQQFLVSYRTQEWQRVIGPMFPECE